VQCTTRYIGETFWAYAHFEADLSFQPYLAISGAILPTMEAVSVTTMKCPLKGDSGKTRAATGFRNPAVQAGNWISNPG